MDRTLLRCPALSVVGSPSYDVLDQAPGLHTCCSFFHGLLVNDAWNIHLSLLLIANPCITSFPDPSLSLTQKVLRDFKAPEGDREVDANGDGEVLVILNLEVDSELAAAGVAREVVNRFQKLRKKAGLVVTDTVEVFYSPAATAGAATGAAAAKGQKAEEGDTLAPLIASRQSTIVESLGKPLLHVSHKPKHAVVIASELVTVGTAEDGTLASFTAILACPAVCFNQARLLEACSGSEELAVGVSTYLASREMSRLQAEVGAGGGKVQVKVDGRVVGLEVGRGIFFSAHAAAASSSQ